MPRKQVLKSQPSASLRDGDEPRRNEATEVASRIASMPDREIRCRYHELVDKSIGQHLDALERFEIERIEVRLDTEEEDLALDVKNRHWDLEREQLINGIESLLRKLKK